jgi:polyvinyl alcohol dehydrogenase (cytochrome)
MKLALCQLVAVLVSVGAPLTAWAQSPPNSDPAHAQNTARGIYLFAERCASCHDSQKDSAPDRYTLNSHAPEDILAALTSGSMAQFAKGLTEMEVRYIAVYLAGRPLGAGSSGDISAMRNACPSKRLGDTSAGAGWNGWGPDQGNSRFQPSAGLSARQVPSLKLKWAFGFPNGNSAYGQPSISAGRVFIGADTGFVYSLDAASGCVYWSYKARAGVRTAITVTPSRKSSGRGAKILAYFGDVKGNVYALNAQTGAGVWMQRADTHPIARILGAPKLAGGRLYVPVASLEESSGGNPLYPCCTFRGSVVAFDAVSGKQLWKTYTIAEEPKPIKKTSLGTQLWGPAGVGIWSTPAIDSKRNVLYVGTGNGYTQPVGVTSDAVLAIQLDTGKLLWAKQVLADDASVSNCHPPAGTPKSETCPEDQGPDYDFGNPPILRTLADGRSLIVIGQKSGDAWALDPDKQGEVVWHRMVGRGPGAGGGGMLWGSAADNERAYFPVTSRPGNDPIGLAAVALANGELAWHASPAVGSGAPDAVIPGVVFSGANNGTMYAYSTTDGHMLWQFDTNKDFPTVNGVVAKGGSLNGAGPVVSAGMLYVPSGYADLGGGIRGNVLLAFGVK